MESNHLDRLDLVSSAMGAMAKMFYCIYYVDLNERTIQELHTEVEGVRSAVGEFGDADTIIDIFCRKLVLPQYRDRLIGFTDLDTLSDRLEGKSYISCDYEGIFSGWSEAIFIEADKNSDGSVSHALFLVSAIADRKKNEIAITRNLLDSYENTKAELDFQQMALDSIQKTIKSAFWSLVLDKNFRTVKCSWSSSFKKMLGYDEDDQIPEEAKFFTDIISPDDLFKTNSDSLVQIADGTRESVYDTEYRLKTKSGKFRWYRSVGRVSVCEDGSYVIFGLLSDINRRKKAEKQLEEEMRRREEQTVVLQSMADFYLTMHLIDLAEDTCIEYNSHSFISEWTSKYTSASDMISSAMKNTTTDEYRQIMLDFVDFSTLSERMKNRKLIGCEFKGVHFGWVKAEFKVVSRNDDGTPSKVIFTTLIIDEEKRKEEELIYESSTDNMTRLYNRRTYDNDLDVYDIEDEKIPLVVIVFDLNGLKEANDTFGHMAGDELIKGAADSLKKIYGNLGKIYRTGGDEFIAVINADNDSIEDLFEDFEIACSNWHSSRFSKIELSISAGHASRADYKGMSVTDLARIADKKMYEAKAMYYKTNGLDRRKIILF